MGKIVLKMIGDTHTMTIAKCEETAGNFGPQVLFSDGPDIIYMPKESADRQLTRLGIDYEAAVGMTLTFSREPNTKKGAQPYWAINYAGTEPAQPKPTARVVPPTVPAATNAIQPRRDAILANYLLLWDAVAGHLAQTSQKYGYGLDAAAIQAATATVWISYDNHGIQPSGLPEAKPVEKAPEIKMPASSGKRLAPPDFSKIPPPDDENLDSSLPF